MKLKVGGETWCVVSAYWPGGERNEMKRENFVTDFYICET